jgi:Tfp pilus assembly protein PilF
MGGEYERASPFFERALVVESGDPLTWLSLARAFEGAGQYPESQEAYEQALALEEDASRAGKVEKRLEEIRDLVSQAG